LIYLNCIMITTISLVNIHLLIQVLKKFSPWDLLCSTFLLSNFQIYHTAVLNIVISLYITSPGLTYLITESVYLLTTFIQFPSAPPSVIYQIRLLKLSEVRLHLPIRENWVKGDFVFKYWILLSYSYFSLQLGGSKKKIYNILIW